MFMPLVETAIAFTVVMLAASLFVSAVVHGIQSLLKWRGKTVGQMVAQIMHGFLDAQGDADAGDASKRAVVKQRVNQFARDVLTDPSLHSRQVAVEFEDAPDKLAQTVEYLHPDDLIALVENFHDQPDLPDAWVGAGKGYKIGAFAAYVKKWFLTVEGTHAQLFKRKTRHLTLGVSCVVVVLFCLDGFQLIHTLWQSRAKADSLAKQSDTLQTVAARMNADTTAQLGLEMLKTATILDEADVGIGWQNSWMTRRWCAWRGACADPPPSLRRLVLDGALWFFGLIFSCVMLSLGAPFWATTLSSLITMKNEVEARKEPPPGIDD